MMKPATSKVKPVPDRYHSVTPYLVVQGVPKLLEFLKQTFNSTELERVPRPDGTISHAEVRIGDSVDNRPRKASRPLPTTFYPPSPSPRKPQTCNGHLPQVPDSDAGKASLDVHNDLGVSTLLSLS